MRAQASSRRPPLGLVLAAAVGPALVLVPIGSTVHDAFTADRTTVVALLVRPLIGELLADTVGLVVIATLLAGLVGLAAAWCVERTRLPGRAVWAPLLAVPLAIPPFVSSYAWISLVPSLENFAGAVLVVTSAYFPLVYLPVAAALRGLDPALEESSRSLGLGPVATFARVVLPQLRPALFGGMLLVALNVLVEFGAFTLLRFRTFTTELYADFRTGFDPANAATLALVLIALCVVCLVLELRLRGTARLARVGAGTRRTAERHRLGAAALPVLLFLGGLALVTIVVPLATIVFWLLRTGSEATTPTAVTLRDLVASTGASIGLGLAGAVVTVTLAVPLGFLAARYDGPAVAFLERAAYLAQGVPGIVVALALVSVALAGAPALYGTPVLLVAAYAIVFLPLALVSVRAAFVQSQRILEESARALGHGRPGVVRRVVLPLAARGLGAAAALVFVSVVTELTATLLLAPIGTTTLATQVWSDTSALAFPAAAPYAAAMSLLSVSSTWLLARRLAGAFA